MDPHHTRNFAIVAHIDHGKSTLADRLLELTGSLTAREMQAQVLDSMDLERERGITIKAHAVRMMYTAHDGQTYQLNLIDTPGHVDFSYEVSRSLASCEGALLIVDASQGVEAQTLANAYLAINNGLEIIPVINKIDLPSADIPRVKEMIEQTVGLDTKGAILVSAKTGLGVPDVLEAIVKRLPPPKGSPDSHLQALIFDSWFDPYRGVIVLTRLFHGTLRKGTRIRLWSNGKTFDVEALGVLTPKPVEIDELVAGEVGFMVANLKNVADTKIGDTITDDARPAIEPLPGFEELKSMVFAGLYTVDVHEHTGLREALEKLRLNDSSFFFEYVTANRVMLSYELPLNEIVLDFYDRLKSISRGYASLDYHLAGQWESPMVKLDILVAGEPVDALSIIVHRDFAYDRGRALVSKMRELIPRQMFEVAIQASIGAKIIARETVHAIRKNVLAKRYGGDISRKRKLLEKQKAGKKRIKRIGKAEIPQEAFLAVLKVGENA